MSVNLENAIHEKLRSLPPEKQQQVLDFLEELGKGPTIHRTLGRVIDEHFQTVPPEEMDELPTDASVNLDHYLYGAPRK